MRSPAGGAGTLRNTRVAPLKQTGREDASAGEGLPEMNPPEGGGDTSFCPGNSRGRVMKPLYDAGLTVIRAAS